MYRDETKNLVEFPYKRVTLDLTLDRYELNSDQTLRTEYYTISGYDNSIIRTAYDTGLPIYIRYKPLVGFRPEVRETIAYGLYGHSWFPIYTENFASIQTISDTPSQIRVNGITAINGLENFTISLWIPS